MHYNNPSLIKFVSWLVFRWIIEPNSDSLSQIRPNQREREEMEEKCYLNSFSTSPHLAETSPPPENGRKSATKVAGRTGTPKGKGKVRNRHGKEEQHTKSKSRPKLTLTPPPYVDELAGKHEGRRWRAKKQHEDEE